MLENATREGNEMREKEEREWKGTQSHSRHGEKMEGNRSNKKGQKLKDVPPNLILVQNYSNVSIAYLNSIHDITYENLQVNTFLKTYK